MLENLSIPHYSSEKGSDNMMGADNQQERLITIGWIVGFIDGEGCFSVTIQKTPSMTTGWQVFPELAVTQGEKSRQALRALQDYFGCGKIFVNRRTDNHKGNLYRFCVRSVADLRNKIIPFFQANPLRTAKQEDFEKFVRVLELMEEKKHLSFEGIAVIAGIVQTMNRKKPSRFLESSETTRQASATEITQMMI
jgi:LAGLIDADG endonuclease